MNPSGFPVYHDGCGKIAFYVKERRIGRLPSSSSLMPDGTVPDFHSLMECGHCGKHALLWELSYDPPRGAAN
jgi:hypothetical protein